MTEIKLLLTDPRGYAAALEAASKVWGGPDETTLQIDALRGMILDQLPAIEEPLAFASVVKVRSGELWVRLGAAQSLPWGSGEAMRSWSQLDVIEVLRVGVGERQFAAHEGDVEAAQAEAYSRGYEEGVQSNLPSPADRSNINTALHEAIEKITVREGRLVGTQHSFELTNAVMQALK